MPGYTGARCQHELDECLSQPCANGAICTDLVNGYRCVCPPGFTGATCADNVDDCSSNPCENGARCHDHLDSYSCECAPGWSGQRCQLNTDDCANSPCRNGKSTTTTRHASTDHTVHSGGTCIDRVNGFTCNCPPGFTGILCQSQMSLQAPCASSPCMFGGHCVEVSGRNDTTGSGFVCECPVGTTGPRCETDLNECKLLRKLT